MAERGDDSSDPVPTFTDGDGYLEARLAATDSVALFLKQGRQIVKYCQERKPSRLLIDMNALRLKLSTLERYEIGTIGAGLAPYVNRAAVIASQDLIDPQKFGVQVANNRGLRLDIFTDREAALAWLKSS